MPDLGIGEALTAFGGGDILGSLGSLLGIGSAEAAPAAAAGVAGAGEAAAGTTLADLVGTGTGLAGGATGLAGTELAGGVSAADIASGAALGTSGLGVGSTALDFLSAPSASGFDATALTPGVGAPGGGPGIVTPPTPAPQPAAVGGSSVFDTGTSAVPSTSAAAPAPSSIAPPGASAASTAAPSGVAGVSDATATNFSQLGQNAAGATPAAAPASSSISDLLSNAGTGAIKSLTNNPLGVALGAGGLGYSIYEGTQNTKNQQALTATAQTAGANSAALEQQGQGLVNYLTNGTLPPQYQTQITQAINSAITQAKSAAAAQGLSTDPTQNTALAAQIAEINNQQPILQEQIAQQLAGTGTSLINAGATAAGLSGNLYQALVQNDTTQAANAGKAIATLAAAMNGKSTNTIGSTTISTG